MKDNAVVNERLRGHAAGVLFAFLIAVSFSLGSRAIVYIEPGALNGVRFVIASLVTALAAYMLVPAPLKKHILKPSDPWRFLLLGGLMGFYMIMMFKALKIASPVSTGAVFTLMPLLSAGFGYLLLRQIAGPFVIFSLLIAALGAI